MFYYVQCATTADKIDERKHTREVKGVLYKQGNSLHVHRGKINVYLVQSNE